MAFSMFGLLSFAVDADYHAYFDRIVGINGPIKDSAYTVRGGRNALAQAEVNIIAGSNVTITGWVASNVGMSKLQYSIDSGVWKDAAGNYIERGDLPSVDFLSDFDFVTVNTTPGFTNCVITGTDGLADGTHTVQVRAVPKDGNAANAFVILELTVNVSGVYKAADLVWRMGNENGSGEYTDEGYLVSTDNGAAPWPVVDVAGEKDLTWGVNTSVYPYAVLGFKGAAGGEVHPYSLGTLRELRSGTSTEVAPFQMTTEEEVRYYILDLCNTGLDIIPSLTFPIPEGKYAGPVVFTDLIFCRSKAEAEQAALPYRYATQTNVDYMIINGLKFGPKAALDWMDRDWTELPVEFREGAFDGVTGGYGVFIGWLASNHAVEKVGYQIDGQDPVFNDAFSNGTNAGIDAATAGIRGGTGTSMAFSIQFPLVDGTHTVRIVAKLQDSVHDFDVFADNPLASYTFSNLESGVKTASLLLGDCLTLELGAVFPDTAAEPGLRVTDADGNVTDLEPVYTDDTGISRHFFYEGIYPQKMTDEYSILLLDGGEVISAIPAKTFSVVQYAYKLYSYSAEELGVSSEEKEALNRLLADLLTFGARAQEFKNYKTECLADYYEWVFNNKTPAGAYSPENVKEVKRTSEEAGFIAATLVIDNDIRFKLKFTSPNTPDNTLQVNHNDQRYHIDPSEWTEDGDSFTVVTEPIGAGALADAFSFVLKEGNFVIARVDYSVESYLASGMVNEDFADALLNYGRSCAAYAYYLR